MSVAEALRAQAAVLSALADQLEAGTSADPDPFVAHPAWGLPGKPSRHASKLPTARRHGRVWLARRSDLARYIAEEGARPTTPALPPKRQKPDDIDRCGCHDRFAFLFLFQRPARLPPSGRTSFRCRSSRDPQAELSDRAVARSATRHCPDGFWVLAPHGRNLCRVAERQDDSRAVFEARTGGVRSDAERRQVPLATALELLLQLPGHLAAADEDTAEEPIGDG